MKLIEIWKRLGKQPFKITQHKEAKEILNCVIYPKLYCKEDDVIWI